MAWWGLPEFCPSCHETSGSGFCAVCAAAFAAVTAPCRGCGLPAGSACPRSNGDWLVARVFAPYRYAPPLDGFVQALKYHRRRALGRAMALLLAGRLAREGPELDGLVPVPLHGSRLRERGYNQAVEIAQALGAQLRLPVLTRGIHRHAAAAGQTGRSAAQRLANVRDAFAVTRNVAGLKLAIVDDVITTGATVNALAARLVAAGAEPPEAWAVARTL